MITANDIPTIVISASADATEQQWQQVLLGIEEEGIPWRWQCDAEGDIVQRAWQAAARSLLLVGLACSANEAVVHYRNLPASQPLFRLAGPQADEQWRQLGNNAARLVKGLPFK
ncbi:propanediol dehydratase reactivation factor small subunit [Serratia fonticola]|uniref:Propanediol dehydratase reactivation factor small subunit n=1 Tax=Serratia fonticola TaxID=47917 RepID=A0A542BNG7_SERFO|nr:glycerol dehydratase reactivase beta/small subunit family protein [Serratia fonticola]TQI80133.1 propanediol dehydratase reactivation factor small subunit [Serratia fonticola]TQI97840.1 propanediol dehydratase reactivation factor small subunit [Serratia fonticola]TVZ72338.1 propanediol dehydratase reactivation factor small subunit [Serratia fonticola]